MAQAHDTIQYKTYFLTWLSLLILTFVIIFLGKLPFSRELITILLVIAMLFKVALIGGYFMHLRFERFWLILAVAFSLLFFGGVLYFLTMPDGLRIFRLTAH